MLDVLGLSVHAAAVYRAMLDHPAEGVEQLAERCLLTSGQVHDGLDELGELMLVRASADRPGRLRAIDPAVGLADMVARQEADLAARQAALAASREAVTRMVADRAEQRAAYGERLLGMDAILGRLERMGREARTEVFSSQPGNQRPEDLEAARAGDAEVLARGVTMRTLYQDVIRRQPHASVYAHWLMVQGSEVRTAPSIPQRIVIVDRAQALVPIDPADNRKGALHVTEPGLLAALLDFLEQAWSTAVPLGATGPEDPESGLTPTETELLRLLGSGITDDTAGQRLGISARTVGRHMASIMERLNATSRFEAGIKAAQHGWI
ncbi:LuxR C-terminal-related transcriptional regulator [Kitasatospora sp. NPDC096147]|uniref:helix-turn-helix transcriptional regulator n=1 Tax=Kitasatospora sp. NPDC096147 TaxID=3364093 RepID=UPI00382A75A4